MKKTSLKEIVKELKEKSPLKRLDNDTKLPYEFDLYWDVKTGRDLLIYDLFDSVIVRNVLAKYGYDVEDWLSRVPKLVKKLNEDLDLVYSCFNGKMKR